MKDLSSESLRTLKSMLQVSLKLLRKTNDPVKANNLKEDISRIRDEIEKRTQ
jgi:hypothetical protein